MNKQMIHTIMKFIRKEISEKQLRQALLKRSHHQKVCAGNNLS